MWFEKLTGFKEINAAEVHQFLSMDGHTLHSSVNGKSWQAGQLSIMSLADLRLSAEDILGSASSSKSSSLLTLSEVVADVKSLLIELQNSGALFQVASQFNLLEMVNPKVTPEAGITIYETDNTQGPACAIACGAGLIYRNYFVPIDNQLGQTSSRQINGIDDFEAKLKELIDLKKPHGDKLNKLNKLWSMENGYAIPNKAGLETINDVLTQLNEMEKESLKQAVRIGVQHNTQVTLNNCTHTVSQAYCSAMPVANHYSHVPIHLWQTLAPIVLEAAYEATLAAGVINSARTGNKTVYLTLLGGGAFGNPIEWIAQAILGALVRYRHSGLNVKIVSHSGSKAEVQQLIMQYENLKNKP
jgi:hypothetical protein